MKCHECATGGLWVQRPILVRQLAGRAQRNAISGRPNTSSGAATIISISCCAMCAEKRMAPSASSGEIRAMTRASQPAANASGCQNLVEDRRSRLSGQAGLPVLHRKRAVPIAYKIALMANSAIVIGSHDHQRITSDGVT